MPWSRCLHLFALWIPAVVFALAGAGKLVEPSGTPPRALAFAFDVLPHTAWLRILGAVELLLAAALLAPKTQRAAAYAGFLLLIAFSALLALNAHDEAFVEDCGCLGALRAPGLGRAFGAFELAVSRNAVLCVLLAAGAYLTGTRPRPPKEAFAHAAVVGVVVLLASLYVGERERLRYAGERLAARERGLARALRVGWRLPDFDIVTPEGTSAHADEVVRARDHLVFLKPRCEYCRRLAPALPDLDRRLREAGARLVLVFVGPNEDVAAFKAAHGCADLPHHRVDSSLVLHRLGLAGVPQMLALDEARRVSFHEARGRGATFADALRVCGRRLPGLERDTWNRIAARLFAEGFELAGSMTASGVVRRAPVRDTAGGEGQLVVLQSRRAPAHYLEIALALGPGDVLADLLVLATGDYGRAVSPQGPDLGVLRGLPLGDALATAARRAGESGLEGPFWREFGDMLAHYIAHERKRSGR